MNRFVSFAAVAALLALGSAAWPDSDDGPGRLPMVTDAATQKACSECHMAYAPQFLPPESWHVMMANLKDHFGEDAHFDPATTAAVEAYLVSHGRPMRGIDPANPPLRITELPWFNAEHGAGLRARAPKGDMGNCVACHNGMGGEFGDDD